MNKVVMAALLGLTSGIASAEGVAVGAGAGTLGIGGEIIFGLREDLNLRLGIGGFEFSQSYEHHGVDYDQHLRLFNLPLILDWSPRAGLFHLSAGLALNQNKIDAEGRPQSGVYTIGNNSYSATQIGSVSGSAKYNSVSPYLGVGWGNPVQPGKRLGWNVDVGAFYQGRPKTSYTVVCGAGVNCAQLQADAAIEAGDFDHDMAKYRFYPVAQFNLTWKF